MGSGDMPTRESSISFVENNYSIPKVPDPTDSGTVNGALDTDTSSESALRKSENQYSCVKGSVEGVNRPNTDLENESATVQSVSGLGEVSPPAMRVGKKPKTNTMTKSATVDSLQRLQSGNVDGPNRFKNLDSSRASVDTTAPIESVREAVSKFGGIADWKMQRVQTLEKRRHIDQELEKIQEEMIDCKKRSKAAEDAEMEVLNELERTKKQIGELELQLSLWSSRIKDKDHDKDLEQEHAETYEAAAKEEELKTVEEAPDDLDTTIKELNAELVAAKESLNAAQVAYKEAEDQRSASLASLEEDRLKWDREVKRIEGEMEKLNQQYLYAKDVKSQLDSANALLYILKIELGSYIGSRMKQETADAKSKTEAENSKIKFVSANKELEKVKLGTEKALTEVGILKLAASSLQSELDKEKEAVSAAKKQVGMAIVTVQSLEEELGRIESVTALIEMRKKEAREKMVGLPSKLRQAAEEADQAKSLKQAADEELQRARDEAEQAKAEACTAETRLHAVEKEIEATKASEKLALAATHGLKESETALDMGNVDSENVVIISLDEYQMLSQCAQEAEEQAKTRLAAALIQIEAAKKSESKSLQKLEEVCQELSVKTATYGTATRKSEKAINEKLRAEQELRSWRTKNEKRRIVCSSASFKSDSSITKQKIDTKKNIKEVASDPLRHTQSLKPPYRDQSSVESDSSQDLKLTKKKKKKSLFPRLLMFFGKRKSHKSRK